MNIQVVKTKPITIGANLLQTLDEAFPKLADGQIVVITSKIVSICEGRVVKNNGTQTKEALVERESELYLEKHSSKYDVNLSINEGMLIASAGIDESNGDGYFVLWPQNPFASAKTIWKHLKKKHNLAQLGVIITDSKITPLRWGTTGIGLAYCGFMPLNDYRGKPDIFGKHLQMTQANIFDGLSAAAVVVMGEGSEQTPVALISEVPFVTFTTHPPTRQEIEALTIAPHDDVYHPLLTSVAWKKGTRHKS